MVYNKATIKPMDKYFKKEFERLEEKFILLEIQNKRTEEAIKKLDTSYHVTENHYHERIIERDNLPDSLLENEWKKFGY